MDRTLSLGPALATPTITVAGTTPTAQLALAMDVQPEYDNYLLVNYNQSGPGRSVTIGATGAWLSGAAAWDLTIPDFSTVAGFQTTWGLQAGTTTDWIASASGWSAGGGLFTTPFVEGAAFQSATSGGMIVP